MKAATCWGILAATAAIVILGAWLAPAAWGEEKPPAAPAAAEAKPPAPAAASETKPPAPATETKPPASPAPAAPSAAKTGIECIDRWEDFIDLTKAPAPWLTWGADLRFRAEYANNNSTLNGDIAGHETSQQKYRPRW